MATTKGHEQLTADGVEAHLILTYHLVDVLRSKRELEKRVENLGDSLEAITMSYDDKCKELRAVIAEREVDP